MHEKWVLGIHIRNREHDAERVQYTLTKFGCSIRTRFGIKEEDAPDNSDHGLILLELTGDPAEFLKLRKELEVIEGIEVKEMVFSHKGC